jgi:chromosome partitioning protein
VRAQVISLVNQKGGCGKTTVSMHIAGALARRGKGMKVLVVDADPQGTATRWAASAADEEPFPASIIGLAAANTKVHREVHKFADDYDYIVIDCPPSADSQVPQSALLITDVALVPVIPSPPDLWAAIGIGKTIEGALTVNDSLKTRLVLNQLQPNTTLGREALEILPEFGIELAKNSLSFRQVYRQCAAFGHTAHNFGSKAKDAINEIEALTDEVIALIMGEEARTANG